MNTLLSAIVDAPAGVKQAIAIRAGIEELYGSSLRYFTRICAGSEVSCITSPCYIVLLHNIPRMFIGLEKSMGYHSYS